MKTKKITNTDGRIIFRITVCLVILAVGGAGMFTLMGMKKAPAEVVIEERALWVETLLASPENFVTTLSGFGQVQAERGVAISSEVPGKIIFVNSLLDEGEIMKKDEVLFRIESSDYLAARASANAEVNRFSKQIMLLKKQLEHDGERLQFLERNRDLSKVNFERQRDLLVNNKVGSLAAVELLEKAYNAAFDMAAQLRKAIELYPLQIEETKENLAAANARLVAAEKNLTRCEVRAPFTGRLNNVSVETGQYVSPGQQLLSLTDDSSLEISVPIAGMAARKWLRFKTGENRGWFQDVEPVECEIRWTEDNTAVWKGTLQRVKNFDPTTRTMTVVVRVDGQREKMTANNRLPLVEGMFCSVKIPGHMMKNVYRLPSSAVSYKNTVSLARGKRLQTVEVAVAKTEDEYSFISAGLKEGDQVIITRLVDPLENSRLHIITDNSPQSGAEDKL